MVRSQSATEHWASPATVQPPAHIIQYNGQYVNDQVEYDSRRGLLECPTGHLIIIMSHIFHKFD